MILAGHSHRNLVFEVTDRHSDYTLTLAEGETIRTEFMDPKHRVLVTSSSGPLPDTSPVEIARTEGHRMIRNEVAITRYC